MKKKVLFSVALLQFLFIGCKGTYCPGFPDNLTIYMPYVKNDVVSFVDNDCDTVYMTVTGRRKYGAEYIEWGCKCECQYPFYSVNLSFEWNHGFSTETAYSISAYIHHFREYATENELGFHLSKGDYEYTLGVYDSDDYVCQKNNDTVLFTLSSDSCYFDSLVVVKGIGLASFNTSDGHKYTLVGK